MRKPGGISLNSDDSISLMKALSLAEGTAPGAAPRKARILRAVEGKASNKDEIPVDLSKVLAGKTPDLALHPNDVLFVPDDIPASAMKRHRSGHLNSYRRNDLPALSEGTRAVSDDTRINAQFEQGNETMEELEKVRGKGSL